MSNPLVSAVKRIDKGINVLDKTAVPSHVVMDFPWGDIRFVLTNTGLKFIIYFREAPPVALFGRNPKIILDIDSTFDVKKLIDEKEGLGIPQPRLFSPKEHISDEKYLNWTFKNGELELGFDFGDLQFPLYLQNATIDEKVSASTDDGSCSSGWYQTSNNELYTGNVGGNAFHTWARWDNLTVAQLSTISNSYVSIRESGSTGSPLTNIYFEKANDPNYPSSYADFAGRTPTTAFVAWDGDPGLNQYHNSASVDAIIQELVNAYGYSNQAMQMLWKDDGSSGAYRVSLSYDYSDHTYGPVLYFEATESGGGSAVPIIMQNMNQFNGGSYL
jgi:hypothetical protein